MDAQTNPFAGRNLVTLQELLRAGVSVDKQYILIEVHGQVVGFEKPGKDRVEIVAHMEGNGKILYFGLQREESRQADGTFPAITGALNVPFYIGREEMLNVGLIQQLRRVLRDPNTGIQGNTRSWELPRGMSKLGDSSSQTADAELEEETGRVTARKWLMGYAAPETSFTPYMVPVFAIQVGEDLQKARQRDPKEKIFECLFRPYSEVRRMLRPDSPDQIHCGFTLSGLAFFNKFLAGHFSLGPQGQVLSERANSPYRVVA